MIGPSRDNARLESSKYYAKERMKHYNIPTADYRYFTKSETDNAHKYLDENYSDTSTRGLPVLKADGLAGGKGVVLPDTLAEAHQALDTLLTKYNTVLVEQRLQGGEVSVFALCDGNHAVFMPPAGDYKRRYDNDRGLNTGGMGAIAPYYLLSEHTLQTHVYPCIRRLVKGEKYTGFLYIGLMVSTPFQGFLDGTRVERVRV